MKEWGCWFLVGRLWLWGKGQARVVVVTALLIAQGTLRQNPRGLGLEHHTGGCRTQRHLSIRVARAPSGSVTQDLLETRGQVLGGNCKYKY